MAAIFLTPNDDTVSYATSNDPLEIYGLDGNDDITGGNNSDYIDGGNGNDTLRDVGGLGDDHFVGGAGNDTLYSAAGNDWLEGGDGNDVLHGNSSGNETLDGGAGNDALQGSTGNDRLIAGSSSAGGVDQLDGGDGNDVYVVSGGDFTIADSSGQDRIETSVTLSLANFGMIEDLTLTGIAAINGTGNDLANTIIGNDAANVLDGGGGNDLIRGFGGNDTLIGGVGGGVEYLYGGAGDDTYTVLDPQDTPVELAGEGHDTVLASVEWTLGDNVEDLVLTGVANIGGTGNALDNHLTGNTGSNSLNGLAGFDTLAGGMGDDTFFLADVTNINGSLQFDSIAENANQGTDTVYVSSTVGRLTYVLDANVENAVVTGGSNFNLVGNEINNALTGNAVANTLTGNGGNDTLNGLAGFDTLIGGAGDDTYILGDVSQYSSSAGGFTIFRTNYDSVTEDSNGGIDTVMVGRATGPSSTSPGQTVTFTSYTLGANVENGIVTGTAAFDLTGNELDNELTGNAVANTLTGNAGNDTLNGLAGFDTLIGGAGDDTYILGDISSHSHSFGGFTIFSTDYDGVTEDSNGGIDTVMVGQATGPSSANPGQTVTFTSYTLGANVENGIVTGADAFDLTGNELDNRLTGNAAANVLSGSAGNDTLNGLAGSDTLDGGSGLDTAIFSGNRAAYTIMHVGATLTVSGPDGTDTLTSIERLQFADVTVPLVPAADFNGDGHSDVLFIQPGVNFNSDYQWQMNDRAISGQGGVDLFDKAFSVQVTGDFNGDGRADVLFENPTTAGVWEWQLNATTVSSQGAVDVGATNYHILGTADFNGDGMSDLLWRSDSGLLYQWQMNGTHDTGAALGTLNPSVWHAVGAGDFTGDGKADILFHYQNAGNAADPANGAFDIWQMNGSTVVATLGVERPDASWKILGVGDFNGDGISDIAIRNVSATPDNGAVWVYLMKGSITTHPDASKTADILSQGAAGIADAATWHVQEIGDLNGDGKDDILFRNDAGYFYSWDMNGTSIASEGLAGTQAGNWADPSLTVVTQHWDHV